MLTHIQDTTAQFTACLTQARYQSVGLHFLGRLRTIQIKVNDGNVASEFGPSGNVKH